MGLARWMVAFALYVDSLLCAGCGNGEGHVAPVVVVKHNDFDTFSLKSSLEPLVPQGDSWVHFLGVSWVSHGCFLDVSWVHS